ncbi:hypothetical protein [Nonlabens antarcticus]|uniref:hypothetical protein n=1 Tax=Nonlabens antarcticus TaxID=392714 RepID=UPI001890CD78|nr:hypothetical protein [Nonlabens antarcticus]
MKNTLFIFLLCFQTTFLFSQVGIGTEVPEADLHVNGSMLVTEEFQLGTLPVVNSTDENFKLLTRVANSTPVGEITVLDVDGLTVAPINVINYEFNDLSSDNLTDLDLGYDTTRYIVGVSNFQYIGAPVVKRDIVNSTRKSIGAFVVRTFIDPATKTWHIEIGNRFLDIDTNSSGVVNYKVTLIIYDRSYFKNLDPIETNLNGRNTGTASSTPNLIN